jgi:hypothetical protein
MFIMWPFIIIFHIQVQFNCFFNPTHKTKTTNRWEITNSKPPRPIIIITIGQS